MRSNRGNSNDNDHIMPPLSFSKSTARISFQPWEVLDPEVDLHARGASNCPLFIIVISLGQCAIDACEEDDNFQWAAYWGRKFRTHPFFGDAIIMIHVAEFMLGTGLEDYCRCGECNPNWFLHGWVCYGYD